MARAQNDSIDDIILLHFLVEQKKKGFVTKHGIPVHIDPVKIRYTDLYNTVLTDEWYGGKTLSHETFAKHLNKWVKGGALIKYPKKGKKQEYGLNPDRYLEIKTNMLKLPPDELKRRLLKIKHDLAD